MSDLQSIAPEAAVELYLDHRADELADKTHRSHGYRLERFVEWCEMEGFRDMTELTGRDLHDYRVWRREDGDLAPTSLQSHMSTLRVFLGFCESIDAVPDDLRSKVLLPSIPDDAETSDTVLSPQLAEDALDYLDRYEFASRSHVIFLLLWRTGMRSGALRALDVDDVHLDDQYLDVRHRPETDTPLKNQSDGERLVAIHRPIVDVLEAYLDGPHEDVTDDHGRAPLISTRKGRASETTIRDTLYRWTRPCQLVGRECPHDREPESCEAMLSDGASKCPSSRSPHDVRRGSITAHLLEDVPMEIVSDRMDVSQDVLSKHYDRRSAREKMEQRREFLGGF